MAEMYNYDDLLRSYRGVGVESGRIVYVTGNFGRPGQYYTREKKELLKAHLTALQEILGSRGTLVVPTHSWSLCGTKIPFDPLKTLSETGPFTEYVRQQPCAVRQFHPFSSSTALGWEAENLCANTSRHVYGLHSPFQRMVDKDALYLSVGQEMERSISLVHHVEFVMGVPYRYTKEFVHPCVVNGEVSKEIFYLFVTRSECDINRDGNKKLINNFKESGTVKRICLGRSFIESLSTRDFFRSAIDLMRRDIYSWLSEPPKDRPYRL